MTMCLYPAAPPPPYSAYLMSAQSTPATGDVDTSLSAASAVTPTTNSSTSAPTPSSSLPASSFTSPSSVTISTSSTLVTCGFVACLSYQKQLQQQSSVTMSQGGFAFGSWPPASMQSRLTSTDVLRPVVGTQLVDERSLSSTASTTTDVVAGQTSSAEQSSFVDDVKPACAPRHSSSATTASSFTTYRRDVAAGEGSRGTTTPPRRKVVPVAILTPSSAAKKTTPSSSKTKSRRVKFADETGRDLTDVRYFNNKVTAALCLHEPISPSLAAAIAAAPFINPCVPLSSPFDDNRRGKSIFYKLAFDTPGSTAATTTLSAPMRFMNQLFGPGVNKEGAKAEPPAPQHVRLESVDLSDKDLTATVTIQVANLTFEKLVLLRGTTDGWLSSFDMEAEFVPPSSKAGNDGHRWDTFVARVDLTPHLSPAVDAMEFALAFRSAHGEFWDNNRGRNYRVRVSHAARPYDHRGRPRFDMYSVMSDFCAWSHYSEEVFY